jgi:hypothetical protein
MNEKIFVTDFKPGQTFRVAFHIQARYKIHIVAIVENMVVFKYYGKHKQRWHYEIKTPFSVQLLINSEKSLKQQEGRR